MIEFEFLDKPQFSFKSYFSFGTDHTHFINGHYIDANCLVVLYGKDWNHVRQKAFDMFEGRFCTDYQFDSKEELEKHVKLWAVRGVIDVENYEEKLREYANRQKEVNPPT